MLSRVLEPEVMDSAEEARDYDGMDHSEVNRVFVTDSLLFADDMTIPLALDVGTGTAQIPIELCRQNQAMQVVAIDMAEEMLKVGTENVSRLGLQQRIQLQFCDAKAMPFANDHFPAVISNSIVHHIPEPKRVFREMVRVTQPNGILFVRDLLRPKDEDSLNNLVSAYAGDANPHQQKMFADSLRAALTVPEVVELVEELGFDPKSVEQTSDRHWTWKARKPG